MRLSVLGTLEFGNFLFGEFPFGHLLYHHSFWIAFKGRVVGQKMTDQMRHFLFLSLALSHSHTHCLSILHTYMFFLSPSLFHTNTLSYSHPLSLSHFLSLPLSLSQTHRLSFYHLYLNPKANKAHAFSISHLTHIGTLQPTHTLTTQTHFITHTESRTRNHAHAFSFILEVDKHVGSNS